MNKKIINNLLLLLASIIWGSAFVAQKAGTVLEPFTYNGIRTLIGGIALIPVIFIFSKPSKTDANTDTATESIKKSERMNLIKGGLACGFVLFLASTLQQAGLFFDTDAGKAGFITTLYIVIVPLIGLILRKRIRPLVWGCIFLGGVGFYFLTMAGKNSGFTIGKGELLILACAFMFSVHILVIDHFTKKCDPIKMSCIQFFVAGILGITCMFIFESPNLSEILSVWFPILYAGVFSAGIGYTLQIIGQKHTAPEIASLILSLESVFALLFGALILSERMTSYELIGSAIIFIAVITAQLPEKNKSPKKLT